MIWIGLMLLLLPPLQAGEISVGLFIALTQAFMQFDIVWGFMGTVNGLAADAEFFKDLTKHRMESTSFSRAVSFPNGKWSGSMDTVVQSVLKAYIFQSLYLEFFRSPSCTLPNQDEKG